MQKISFLKKLTYILLFIAFAFRPAYHLAYIGYYQLNIDYIIETYCVNKDKPELQCNGKCHLAKQITPEVDGTDKDTKGINTISEAFFPVFKDTSYKYTIKNILEKETKNNWSLTSLSPINFIKHVEQPPDFLI